MDRIDAALRLAKMPEHSPERCLVLDHAWTSWGSYRPGVPEPSWLTNPPPVAPQSIKAWRRRICRQCGCEQVENYDGTERIIVADPSGIERRIIRSERPSDD